MRKAGMLESELVPDKSGSATWRIGHLSFGEACGRCISSQPCTVSKASHVWGESICSAPQSLPACETLAVLKVPPVAAIARVLTVVNSLNGKELRFFGQDAFRVAR